MKEIDLRKCIACIENEVGNQIGGTGFVVTPNWVVTCAHVITALKAIPGDVVHLSFAANGERLAEVVTDGWKLDQDVAFLKLKGSLPEGVIPAILGPSKGMEERPFRTFGYPGKVDEFKGVWATGKIAGPVVTDKYNKSMLQVRSQEIDQGMSGAPVLDVDIGRVVGMVNLTYHPDKTLKFRDASFAIPAEVLEELCPVPVVLDLPKKQQENRHQSTSAYGDGNVFGDGSSSYVDKSVTININVFDRVSTLTECSGQLRDFEQFYLERNYFGGRREELTQLDNWLERSEKRNAILSAPAGLGKSALVTRWVSYLQQTRNLDLDIVYHPISLRFETHRRNVVLKSLVSQIVNIYDRDYPIASDVNSLQSSFSNLLLNPPDLRCPLLVVIDGLDELDTMPDASLSLPRPAEGIHLLVTVRSISEETVKDITHWRQTLRLGNVPLKYLRLTPLVESDITEVIKQTGLAIAEGSLNQLTKKLHYLSEGHPLLVGLYLQRLKDDEELTVELFLKKEIKPGLGAYIERVEEQLDRAYDQVFLGLLSAALGPLYLNDLDGLGLQKPPSDLIDIIQYSRGLIIGDGESGGFTLSHPLIGYAYTEKYPVQVEEWQDRFVHYGKTVFQKLKQGKIAYDIVPSYVLDYYAMHLRNSNQKATDRLLFQLICEEWMQAHLAKSGSHVHFLRDIDLIWERAREIKIDDKIDLTDLLEVQWRCALSRSSVTALASNFPPLLPALLARDGVADWGISQAHAYANAIPDPVQRAKAKLAFLDLEDIDIRPSQRTQITSEVLSALRSSKGTDRTKGRLLISLLKSCKSLTASQTETALEVIDGFAKPLWRAKGLAQLISDIDDEEVQLKALANIIRSCRETGGAFEAFHHLPYLYAEIANNLPLNLLGQATTEAFDNSEMWYGRKHEFFAELAWHIVPQQAEEFMKVTHMQCPSHFSLTGVAIVLSRVSSKLSDEVALKLAEELARQYRAGDSLDRTFYRTFWYTGGGCIPAFLILAYHRAELKNRRRLLNLSRELINEFGEDEHSMTQDDLWTLYRIIEGSCSDEEAAQLVIKEGFLKGFFIGGQKFGLFSEEIVDCLGPETLKAILKPVTRPPDDWHFCIGKSGYFLPKIASKLSDQEWPLVYRIGPGRGEYATLGYIRATTQNITREGTPEELRKELIKWALGGWYDRSPESRQEMLLSVASYVVPGDILDDDGYSTGLRTIELMAPNLSTEVKRAVLSVSIPVSYTSEKSERRALEFTTNIVRYLRTRRERAKWLQSLLQKQSKITDLDQQIQFLTALIGLSDRPCRRSIRKLGTQIQSRKKLQQRELKRREWLHWSNSLKKNEDNSAPSLISKCLSFLANSTTIWRYVWPISSFLMEIFNDFTNLDWQRIFFLISRYRPISCYLKTMLGDFGSQDWGHSLAGEQSLNDGLKQITETGIRVHPDVSLSEADLTHLRIQVRALCELKDSRKRQSALLEIARIIDGLRIAYPFNVFGVYIKRCEDIWRDLDPAFAVDALHVLQNPNMFREINVPYPYRILIPVILTKRPSLLPEVLKALDKYPWREDKGITYAEAAYFSKGEEQLSILKKAVEAADRDVDRNESRLWTLNAIATYAPNSITENLLSWIEKRPYVSPLIKLAPNIASVPRYRNKALDIACRMSRKRPVHKLICAMAPYLDGDGIVKSVQMIVDRGIPIDGYITQDSKSEEDDPVLSYYCLVQCLLELPKNIIYETWSRSLKIISTQSREDLLLHAIWWLPVIIKLGGQEVLISTAQAVSELGDWQWYSLET